MAIETRHQIEKPETKSWTLFWDMHSGGGCKTGFEMIYIEAPEKEAVEIFEERFNRDPYNVTCNCCGGDYSIDEYDSLEEASEFHRKISYSSNETISIEEYSKKEDVLIIYK